MDFKSWHFFIPLGGALPVANGFPSYKDASGYTQIEGGDLRPRPDGVALMFHHGFTKVNPFPSLATSSHILSERSVGNVGLSEGVPSLDEPVYETVCEVVVSRNYSASLEIEPDEVSDQFDFAVEQLNQWISALSIVVGYPIALVRRELLPPFIPVASGLFEPWELKGRAWPRVKPQHLLQLNMNIPAIGGPPDVDEKVDGWLDSALANIEVPGPFVTYHELRMEGQDQFSRLGNYRISIVLFAAAAESLIDELLQHLLWESNYRPEDAAVEFSKYRKSGKSGKRQVPLSVSALVRERLSGFLGFDSNGGALPGPIENWMKDVSFVRNAVIHDGHRPGITEMKDCIDSFDSLVEFLSNRVFSIRESFPVTALALLGEAGLQRRGAWFDGFDQLELTLEELYERMRAFRGWSKCVSAFRNEPYAFGGMVDLEKSHLLVVKYESRSNEVYAEHVSLPLVSRIPLEAIEASPIYQNMIGHDSKGMDPLVIVSSQVGISSSFEELTWDLFKYDVVPGPFLMCGDLKESRGW